MIKNVYNVSYWFQFAVYGRRVNLQMKNEYSGSLGKFWNLKLDFVSKLLLPISFDEPNNHLQRSKNSFEFNNLFEKLQ